MLKRFEVSGYRNFETCAVLDLEDVKNYSFQLECLHTNIVKTALLFGQNSQGKTNFGHALMDITQVFTTPIETQNNTNADSTNNIITFVYAFLFNQTSLDYKYQRDECGKLIKEELSIDDQMIFDYDHQQQCLVTNGLSLIHASTLNLEFVDMETSFLSYVIHNTAFRNDHVLKQLFHFVRRMKLIKTTTIPNVLESQVQRVIIEDKVQDFEGFLNTFGIAEKLEVRTCATGRKALYLDHKRLLPFLTCGTSSMIALLQLYVNLMDVKDNEEAFFYIDDFDAYYHYETAEKIVEMFKQKKNVQVIMTSHHTNLLTTRLMRPDCIFLAANGKVQSFAHTTSRKLEEGHHLENLYKSKEFDL